MGDRKEPRVVIPRSSGVELDPLRASEPDTAPARYYEAVESDGGDEDADYRMFAEEPLGERHAAHATGRGDEDPDTGENFSRQEPAQRGRVERFFASLIPWEEIVSYRAEFSGMLGDLGLYIPLVISLSMTGQISLGATLIFSGLSNIITGLHFKVPMCVQPMKSISAAALAENFTNAQIMASGLATSAIVTFLGATNLIGLVNSVVPNPVVRGLQLGLGLLMFKKAASMLPVGGMSWSSDAWLHWDGSMLATFSLAAALVCVRSTKVPTAALLFLLGIIIAAVRMSQSGGSFRMSVTTISPVHITPDDFLYGFIHGAIPQVPTTLLNSCLAVCKLSDDLYPGRKTNVNVRSVSTSVGMLNLIFNWFGGLPMCHGAGGLAGQHRFGARTNLSIITLGACKLVLGLFFASGMLELLRFFPSGILAAMLAISAFELASASRSAFVGDADTARMCLLTCCFTAYFNTAVGFCGGMLAAYLVMLSKPFLGEDDEVREARSRVRAVVHQVKERAKRRYAGEAPSTGDNTDHSLECGIRAL